MWNTERRREVKQSLKLKVLNGRMTSFQTLGKFPCSLCLSSLTGESFMLQKDLEIKPTHTDCKGIQTLQQQLRSQALVFRK